MDNEADSDLRRPVLMGALAGLTATAPMTAAMLMLHRTLPLHERQALPPRRIMENLASRIGRQDDLTEGEETVLSLAGHFAYGAAMGGFYSLFYRRFRFPAPLSGVVYGLIIWVSSYFGWLPTAHILPPASKEAPARNFLMIFAHIVWGVFLDLTLGMFRRPRDSGAWRRLTRQD